MAAAPRPSLGRKFLEFPEDAIASIRAPVSSESDLESNLWFLAELTRQVEDIACTLQNATTAPHHDGPERTRQIALKTAAQLRSVKLLLEHVEDEAWRNPGHPIAEQVRRVRDSCAAADAAFELAARAFAASRALRASYTFSRCSAQATKADSACGWSP